MSDTNHEENETGIPKIVETIDLIARNLSSLSEKVDDGFDKVHKGLGAISDDNRLIRGELKDMNGSLRSLIMLSGESDREMNELRSRVERLKEQSGFE